MSTDFIFAMRVILEESWKLLTCFHFPGLNFTPAVFLWGLASFGLALILIKGIITITSTGLTNSASAYVSKGQSIRAERKSRSK